MNPRSAKVCPKPLLLLGSEMAFFDSRDNFAIRKDHWTDIVFIDEGQGCGGFFTFLPESRLYHLFPAPKRLFRSWDIFPVDIRGNHQVGWPIQAGISGRLAKTTEYTIKPILHQKASTNSHLVPDKEWNRGIFAGNPLRMMEIMEIVTAIPTYRQRNRKRLTTSSGTSDPLLIIESLRRHVGEHDAKKGTYIDAHFHRSCDSEQVDSRGKPP